MSLTAVANEAARQLREMADARGVEIRIAENLSTLTVDVGRLELALLNLLSNAIKSAIRNKADRFVQLTAEFSDSTCRIAVRETASVSRESPHDDFSPLLPRSGASCRSRHGHRRRTGTVDRLGLRHRSWRTNRGRVCGRRGHDVLVDPADLSSQPMAGSLGHQDFFFAVPPI